MLLLPPSHLMCKRCSNRYEQPIPRGHPEIPARDGLGLKTDGIVGTEFEHGAVAFFDLQAGLKLALWPRASLARA